MKRAASLVSIFLVASVLLLGFMAWQRYTRGSWDVAVSTAFFLSQAAYWGSLLYYGRRGSDEG